MPGNDRISALLSAVSGALSQEKLELLSREFNSLAHDRAETLVFFVLQNVCQRLASALEGEAVSVERYRRYSARRPARKRECYKARDSGRYALSKFRFIPSLKIFRVFYET